MIPSQSIEIFLSYSPEDKELRDKLAEHLRDLERQETIKVWDDGQISAGTDRQEEIEEHLNRASIILLLVSANFIGSNKLHENEVRPAMSRHDKREARVIPILLRSCVWKTALFGKLKPLPSNKTPITSWLNQDEAFTDVVQGIQKAVKEISGLKEEAKDKRQPLIQKWLRHFSWYSFRNVSLSSMCVSFIVIFLRFFGSLEMPELWFFDTLMRLKAFEGTDQRLLVVEVTPKDIEDQGNEPRRGSSLTDKKLWEILSKLLKEPKNKPKVIGLDIYRNFKTEPGELYNLLQNKNNFIFALCNIGDRSRKNPGVQPPPEFVRERLGFSDFFPDKDGILRRQTLIMENNETSPCRAKSESDEQPVNNSFALELARSYINQLDKRSKPYIQPSKENPNVNLKIDGTIFESLHADFRGGYSMWTDLNGYQILLNYRISCLEENQNDCSPENIAKKVTVTDVLKDDFLKKFNLNNKLILIGVADRLYEELWYTPFSYSKGPQEMSGVIIQAQMVSQILSAVLDNRTLLRVWSIWSDMLWIFTWSLIGGILAQRCRTRKSLAMFGGLAFLTLPTTCLMMFIFPKIWIPFVPPVLSFFFTGGVVLFIRLKP